MSTSGTSISACWVRFQPMTFIPMPLPMRATSRPMPPSPITPKRLAKKLHAFMRCPDPAAHLSIHAREIAGTGPQQRNRMLGDRGVSVTLDDVHLDATLIQLADIHVAGRPGAEEDDVLELGHCATSGVGM